MHKDRHYEFLVELDYSKADLISGYEWVDEEARLNALGALEEQYAELSAAYEKSCEAAEQTSNEDAADNSAASVKVNHPAAVTLEKDKTTGKMTAKVLLKTGESITLSGIPAGTEYTVTELNADGKPMGDNVMNEFDGELIATEHAVHKGDIPGYIIKDGEIVNGSAEEDFANVRFDEGGDEGGSGGGDGMDITDNDVPKGDLVLDDGDVPLGNREDSDAPKTGDESNLYLWLILAAAALAGIGGLAVTGKKKEKAGK